LEFLLLLQGVILLVVVEAGAVLPVEEIYVT
jgi:hypothetical protein